MINPTNMGLVNQNFSGKIMDKYGNLSLSNSDFITKLFKKLYNYPYKPPGLIYALPFILRRLIFNKYLKMISSKSPSNILFHNIPINLDLNLPFIQRLTKEFEVSSVENTENFQKHQFNDELFLPSTNPLFVTYSNKLLNVQKSEKHLENIITRFNDIERDEKQINKYFKEVDDGFSPYNIRNSLLATNLILNKYNVLKNYKELFDDDYIVNNIIKKEFKDYGPNISNKNGEFNVYSSKISNKNLFYRYPEIEHLKTFQEEVIKEKTMEREVDSEFPVSKASVPSIDVNKMADQVYSIIERKIKIERERRGLSA